MDATTVALLTNIVDTNTPKECFIMFGPDGHGGVEVVVRSVR